MICAIVVLVLFFLWLVGVAIAAIQVWNLVTVPSGVA